MTSRLDRLFVLLESGSTAGTRRAAAQQLGAVQRLRPRELHRLLGRVQRYLRAPAWETRVAAGQAVHAVLSNLQPWDPQPLPDAPGEVSSSSSSTESSYDLGRLRFATFDVDKVLSQGAHLMGSEGNEYDMEDDSTPGMDMREKLARQRQLLNARLGLDVASKMGMDISEVFSNEDLMAGSSAASTLATMEDPGLAKAAAKKCVTELMSSWGGEGVEGGGLSSREKNRARRLARQQKAVEEVREEPDIKKPKLETYNQQLIGELVPESDGSWGPGVTWWPLESWAASLAVDLFSPWWEARHGAATALRHLLATHARGAGKERGTTRIQMEEMHQSWLEDISLRLVCVLALDRFGDFVSDQVVAPVRETCAQCLGAAASLMSPAATSQLAAVLARLAAATGDHWEARHGALLGLKYLLAVQQEMRQPLSSLRCVVRSLWDPVEDVSAAGAQALAGVAGALACQAPQAVPRAVARLRRLLRVQDELAAACGCYMALLAALMKESSADQLLGPQYMASVIPRLWPYLSHPTSAVRRATLQTLRTLTQCSSSIFGHRQTTSDLPRSSNDLQNLKSEEKTGTGNEKSQMESVKEEKFETNSEVSEENPMECIKEEKSIVDNDIQAFKKENYNTKHNSAVKDEEKADFVNKMGTGCIVKCDEQNKTETNLKLEWESIDNVGLFKSEGVGHLGNGESWTDFLLDGDDAEDRADDMDSEGWNAQLLQDALRHVFQRILIEHIPDIQNIVEEVWNNLVRCSSLEYLLHAACPFVSTWICLSMQPAKVPFDQAQLIHPKLITKERKRNAVLTLDNASGLIGDISLTGNGISVQSLKLYVGGSETTSASLRESNLTRARCAAARMLGLLSCYIVKPAPGIIYTPEVDSPIDCYINILQVYLSSKSAVQRLIAGLIIAEWAQRDPGTRPCHPALASSLHSCLTQPIYYDEIAVSCTRILQDTRDFISMMRHYKVTLSDDVDYTNIISLEQVLHITGPHGQELIGGHKLKPRTTQTLEDRRKSISAAAQQCYREQNTRSIETLAALAGACAELHALPDKLNPVIRPLMDAIKREETEGLQDLAARRLAQLLKLLPPGPNNKVLNNLCTFLAADVDFTPRVAEEGTSKQDNDATSGIVLLGMQQRQAERASLKRSHSVGGAGGAPRGPGRPPNTDIPMEELFPTEDENQKQLRVQRRGASRALCCLAEGFGDQLVTGLPKLWEIITHPFNVDKQEKDIESVESLDELISNLQVLECVCPSVHEEVLPLLLQALPSLAQLLTHKYRAVRHMAARSLAALANVNAPIVMEVIVDKVVPMLGAVDCDAKRQGAAEALAAIVDKLQINIVPFIVLLVLPLLGRMSDSDMSVRLMSTHCFATLVQLMPLEGAVKESAALSQELAARRDQDRCFLEQLFNPKAIGDYKIPVPVKVELRGYQQAGVNWLAFLNKYKLHGVLCDDMGLGKTLQSLCMVAGDHYERSQRYKETQAPDAAPLPSLVICPPTLTGHWVYEVKKFLSSQILSPLLYAGPPPERERLRVRLQPHSLVVASYDIVRKDIHFFSSLRWNYCVLDEGHVIKNGKTKASQAIKMLVANHRLILSGTPIQNNVLELWSLFDFLMPGLLGSERQFTARYSRPILAARDSRATAQHQEAGALAMEALHRQVLPFLLRRVKEDVLHELPAKIVQDYYCELSPLQRRLYEDFSRGLQGSSGVPEVSGKNPHVFQALRYLQNVCNHPKLVLTPQHPEYRDVMRELSLVNSSLNDVQHSAKLPALKQLLEDCGIGSSTADSDPVVSPHRALIFCQLKAMLDTVERDLLKAQLPRVAYLRLDGSVPPSQRQQLVHNFNTDPSIDVLLLTTQVGGLGLNLTGADTVIFVEHDWNPMKDLQAMDRAHRIGQKKVVNVYRLITKGTLEEKIMGLQKFKLQTANTVISSENASLETMATDQLLELFQTDKSSSKSRQEDTGQSSSIKNILESLPDLWDDQQYETEYDLANFVKGLDGNIKK